jgi:hypothetical protein
MDLNHNTGPPSVNAAVRWGFSPVDWHAHAIDEHACTPMAYTSLVAGTNYSPSRSCMRIPPVGSARPAFVGPPKAVLLTGSVHQARCSPGLWACQK